MDRYITVTSALATLGITDIYCSRLFHMQTVYINEVDKASEANDLLRASKYQMHVGSVDIFMKDHLLDFEAAIYYEACEHDDVATLNFILPLLDEVYTVNEKYNGLMRACNNNAINAIEILVKYGIPISAVNKDHTAMHYAIRHCYIDCIVLMIDKGWIPIDPAGNYVDFISYIDYMFTSKKRRYTDFKKLKAIRKKFLAIQYRKILAYRINCSSLYLAKYRT